MNIQHYNNPANIAHAEKVVSRLKEHNITIEVIVNHWGLKQVVIHQKGGRTHIANHASFNSFWSDSDVITDVDTLSYIKNNFGIDLSLASDINKDHTMRNYINNAPVKGFILPFLGFYQSHIDCDLDEQLQQHIDYISECDSDKGEQLEDWLYSGKLHYAYKSFYNVVASQIVEFIQDKLNDYYKTNIKFYNVNYQPMTLQNTGDNIHAYIEAKNIPSLELISEYTGLSIEELFSELQALSDSKLKSCSGFSSFYDHDLTPLKGIDVKYWNDAYISLIIDFLVNDFFGSINAMELAFIEDSYSTGGMIETFLQCLNSDDLNTFNSFE